MFAFLLDVCFGIVAEASVSFSNAIIYDGLDLEGVQEEVRKFSEKLYASDPLFRFLSINVQ